MKKILLIQPTIYDDSGSLIKVKKLYFIGLTMPLLAALTPPKWQVDICIESVEDIPFNTDASIVGIGSMGHSLKRAFEISAEFKKRGKTVIMGGMMASLIPEETIKHCDSVIIGDGEVSWGKMFHDIENGGLKRFYNEQIDTFSTPLPKYELITNKAIGDFLPVQAGRGCPNTCSFCSIYCIYKQKYLRREISEVIRDIKRIKELGFKKFLLIDDNIIADREYMKELCSEIKSLNMKWMSQCAIELANDEELLEIVAESGCTTLSFGLESISKANLCSLNKDWCDPGEYKRMIDTIHRHNINVASEMMVGLDGDTAESLKETAKFVINNKIEVPKFYIITPIPGTVYFEEISKTNRLINRDIESYSPSKAVITTEHFGPEQLTDAYWELYRSVYSIPSIIRRTLLHKRFLKTPFSYLFVFFVNMVYRYQIKKRIAPIII